MRRYAIAIGLFLVALTMIWAKPVPAPKAPNFSGLKDESIKKWAGAEVLITGKLTEVIAGPVGLSNPPVRTYKMQIAAEKVLRGVGKLDKLDAAYSVKQQEPPTFPTPEKNCLIALKFVRGAWVLQSVEEVNATNVDQAILATSFPLGWTVKEGKLVSPWAAVGKPGKSDGVACSVTGRPVLLVGDGISFEVEPVPPPVKMKFGNPDGDGEYKLIVKNTSDAEREVAGLLTDGKDIRWNECVVIRCQDKTYPIPGSTGDVAGLKPVVLKPGESVSGTTHALALQGPMWPMGGYRIEFQFCLAERSATHSFYYLSKHHDPIRDAVQKGLKK